MCSKVPTCSNQRCLLLTSFVVYHPADHLRLDLQHQLAMPGCQFVYNPASHMRWTDEDMVGRVARISRRTHPLTTASRTIDRALANYRRMWAQQFDVHYLQQGGQWIVFMGPIFTSIHPNHYHTNIHYNQVLNSCPVSLGTLAWQRWMKDLAVRVSDIVRGWVAGKWVMRLDHLRPWYNMIHDMM